MSYSDYLGSFVDEPWKIKSPIYINKKDSMYISDLIDRPRLGIPTDSIVWEEHKSDIDILINIFIKDGYFGNIPKNLNKDLIQHLMYFRANLDIYDELIENKVFCRDEIYFRCLQEGPAFCQLIKKARNFSLQNKICIGENNVPTEYICRNYSGYDSIIHERYLINWDETDDTVDWPYSLIQCEKTEIDYTTIGLSKLIVRYQLKKLPNELITLFEPVANKKSSTLEGSKTTLLKNTWDNSLRDGSYMAVRKVIPIEAGNVRDTGVPDVQSLCKLKLLHQHIRNICEKLPYSANCNFATLNQRLARLRRKSVFIHIDFKKFGLTFPRKQLNKVLEMLDLEHLKIDEFILRNEDGDIRTNRGGVLGWFDGAVAIATISILTNLAERQGWKDFDMLQFNDDIEIGFGDLPEEEIRYRQDKIVRTLVAHDFIMSNRKIFSSKESIFLEDYEGFETLDMSKMQLAVRFFAKSLCTQFRWEARLMYSMGRNYGYTKNIERMCFENIKMKLDNETKLPVELGGWIFLGSEGLNRCLEDATPSQISFFMKMKKYKEPHVMPKYVVLDVEKILKRKESAVRCSTGPVDYHKERIKLDDSALLSKFELETLEYTTNLELPQVELPKLPPRPPRPKQVFS